MKGQKKKRNHWVPQAYLRAFAADADRRKIWTLRKDDGDPELRPIRKVAVKHYLYAPMGPEGRDYRFEEKLSSLEGFLGSPYWQALCTDYVDLCDPALRKMVSLLTAVMFLRNPRQLAWMEHMHRSLVDMISAWPVLPDSVEIGGREVKLGAASWPEYRDASPDDIKRMWIGLAGSATWLAEILLEMRWCVQVAGRPAFVTTDNPVVLLHKDLRFRGFRNPGTTVVLPVSPTRVLAMDHRHGEPDGQYYPSSDGGAGLNGLLWRNAIAHMFSSRHPDEVCAEIVSNAEAMGFA